MDVSTFIIGWGMGVISILFLMWLMFRFWFEEDEDDDRRY